MKLTDVFKERKRKGLREVKPLVNITFPLEMLFILLSFVSAVNLCHHFHPVEASHTQKPTALHLRRVVPPLVYLPRGAPFTLGEMMCVLEYFG